MNNNAKIFLMVFINVLILAGAAYAGDVAYILKNTANYDHNVVEVLNDKGLTVDFIDDSLVGSTNFSNYKMLVVGDELFSNPNSIPVNDYPSLILNSYHVDEWGWTDTISSISSNQPLQVISNNLTATAAYISRGVPQVANIYTSCCYDGMGISLPLYYFDRLDSALSLLVVSSTIQHQYNRVVTVSLPGNTLLDGKMSKARACFFGAAESDYWTENARTLIGNCADWVANGADKDGDGYYEGEDCNDNDASIHPNAVELDDGIDQNCINDMPVMQDLPGISFNEDGSNNSLDLDNYVADVDNTDASLIWSYSGNTNVNVSINNITHVVTFTSNLNYYGQETLTFTAKDPGNLQASKTLAATVLAVNDAPTVNAISNVNIYANSLISVTVVASDVENDSLTYSMNSTKFAQNGNVFSWQTNVNDMGSYSFTATVSDGSLQTSRSFDVDIYPMILLNEVNTDPMQDRTNDTAISPEDEFIELYNPSDVQVIISNYQLMMNDLYPTTQLISGTIPSHGYLTIYNPSGSLDDNGNIVLKNHYSQIIDSVSYGNYNDGNIEDNALNGTAMSLNDECLARYPDGTDTNVDKNDFIKKSCTPSNNNELEFVAPIVNLISPANNAVDYDGDVTFTFNATNNDLASCSLIINSEVNQTKNESGTYVEDSFVLENLADNSAIAWTVRCVDALGNVGSAPVRNLIVQINDAPVMQQIPDQTIDEDIDGSVNLASYASDPENDSLTFEVTQQDTNKVSCVVQGSLLTLHPASNFNGVSSCKIIARDASLSSNEVIINIIVLAVNDAPVMQQIPNKTIDEDTNSTVNLVNYASDIDGDSLIFEVIQEDSSKVDCDVEGNILKLNPILNFNGVSSCKVIAKDASLESNEVLFSIIVNAVNDVPAITSTPKTTATQDALYSYDADATDVEGDEITYSLMTYPTGMIIDSANGLISWMPMNSQVGNNSVTLKATDANNGTATQSFVVDVANVNDAPVLLVNIPDFGWDEDNVISVNISEYFDDIDDDVLTYTIKQQPSSINASINNGIVTFTPDANYNGITSIQFTVSDGEFSVDSNIVQLIVDDVNDVPTITSSPITTGTQDVLYTYDADATDVEGDEIAYSLTIYPTGMTIDSASGLISWAPTNSNVGNNSVTLKATDANNGTTTQSFVVDVANVNDAPVLLSDIPNQAWDEDTTISINISNYFDDIDDDVLTYTIKQQPSNIAVSIANGIATFTPDANYNGITSIQFTASDGELSVDSNVVQLTVSAINDAPVLAYIANIGANEGDLITITADASDSENDQLVYSIDDARFQQNNNVFTWQSTLSDSGTYIVNVSVSDGYAADSQVVAVVLASIDNDDDGILNQNDNCPNAYNPGQEDSDSDGIGDACDSCNDADDDSVCDNVDNCLGLANPDQKNNDNDQYGDECDSDDDNDGIEDGVDNCQFHYNPGQEDEDNDGIGDECDNYKPTITTTPPTTATVNKWYTYRMVARDAEMEKLSYSVSDERFVVDGSTFKFLPEEAGIVDVIFSVHDQFGNQLDQHASINVVNATVSKERHDLQISSAIWEKEAVKPGEHAEMYVKISNYGNKIEKNVHLTASIPELGVSETTDGIELRRHGNKMEYFDFKIPSNAKKGVYAAKLTLYNNNDKVIKYLSLEVPKP